MEGVIKDSGDKDNISAYDLNKPIHRLFEEQVKATPDLPCVIFQERKLTYTEVNERSSILARHLQNLGIKSGDLIAVALKRSENLIVAILAVLKLDCIYVPIDLSIPLGRLQFIFGDAEPRLTIAAKDSEDLLRTFYNGKIMFIAEETFSGHATLTYIEIASSESFSGENIAYIIYTSGSTGNPKGVCCTHKGLVNRICWMRDHYQIGRSDNVLHKTPIGFDVSLWELFLPLISGGCLIVAAPEAHKDNQAILDLVAQESVTVIHFVPSMFRAFLHSSDSFDCCVSLHYIFCSGEALALDIAKLFFDNFSKFSNSASLHNVYGPTEAAIDVSFYDCNPAVVDYTGSTVPIGKPIVNTQLYILDEYLKPMSSLMPGELFIGGVGLAKEYLKRPDLTKQYFLPNPFGSGRIYRTGDIVVMNSDGNIEFLGRKDTQVKIRGYRIELGEIEMNLMKIPGVANAAVTVREDLIVNSKLLVGYIQKNTQDERFSTENEVAFMEMVQEYLNNILPSYMIPSKYVFLDNFPLTISGKLDRKALPKPVTKIDDNNINNSNQSRTEMENILIKIWCEVMGFDQLALRDNFFQMGGDSIISMQIRSRAKDYGVMLSVRDIFDYPTIKQLSVVLDGRKKETSIMMDESKENGFLYEPFGEIPLLPVQHWFFEQQFENINFWNQYILVKPNVPIEQELLYKAMEVLSKMHAILNVRFDKMEQDNHVKWVQNCSESADTLNRFLFTVKEMKNIQFENEEQKMKAIDQYRMEAENLIDIQSGVLWGVILFEFCCDDEIDQRVLFFAHHLLMDGVSLRIVMSDLENIYDNIVLGNEKYVQVNQNITSFRNWSFILLEYAKSMRFAKEIEYWRNILQFSKEFSLPLADLSLSAGQTIFNVRINEQTTCNLIHKANAAYKTEIKDILLTAFVLVLSEWTGKQKVVLELEGHGREEEIINRNSTVDLTKTVGWFTSMFPVCLHIENPSDLGHCLKLIKEQLRRIPKRGIDYGIFKYLKNVEFINGNAKEPDICFNYLGQFDNIQKSNQWSVLKSEDSISPENHLHKSIIVDSLVCEGVLEISWRYKNCISLTVIENLAKMFVGKLEDLISHCCDEISYGYSISDFPLLKNNLDQKTVDESFGNIRGITDIMPLCPMQLGMYFQNSYNPNTDNYLVQKVYEINGDLKVDIFEESWQKVISHYDIIRTGYVMINGLGIPVQFVLSSIQSPFKYLDWSLNDNIQDKTALFRKFIFEDRRKKFDLKTPPLLRITLVKISQNRFLLLWTMHHLILDGWSIEIIIQSFLSCYRQRLSGNVPEISYPTSFREYISWIASPQRESHKVYKYFESYLQTYFPKENLASLFGPLARRQSIIPKSGSAFEFENLSCKIKESLLIKLKEKASAYQVTLSTVIEFTWGMLLSRFTGENDIVFGLTISGRSEQQNHDVVGLLINTLPVRIQFDDKNELIQGHLTKLQTDVRKLEEFSHISLAEVQSTSLKCFRSGSDSDSLFDTILIFENYPVDSIQNDNGFEITCIETIEATEYPLTVAVSLLATGEMAITVNFKKKYFLTKHVQCIIHAFHALLEDIATNPKKSLSGLNILTENDKRDFFAIWKGEMLNLEECSSVIDLVFENVERAPNSFAIIDGDRKVTYKELFERASEIASLLKSVMGNVKWKHFVIIMERSAELIFAIVSVFLVGGVYIPVDPSTPESRIKFILGDTEAMAVLTVKAFKSKLEDFNGHIICLDDETETIISCNEIAEQTTSENAYIIYTSGSTGNPKGCLVSHDNLKNYLLWARNQYCNAKSSTTTNLVPLHSSISFDLSITSILLPLISGQTIVVAPDSLGILGLLNIFRVYKEFRLLKLTPSHIDVIYEAFHELGTLPKVQCLVIGGENLLTSQIIRWRLEQPETKIFNEYGPTECTVGCTAFEITNDSIDGSYHSVPIGKPITNTSIYVLDKRLNLVPKYILGELYVGGKCVTNGYLNLPGKTKQNFIKNPFGDGFLYSTGDTVRYCDDSVLEYLGRSDRQIKLRGYRIELGEIEVVLRNINGISEAAVVLIGNELNAFVVLKVREIRREKIVSTLEEKLPKYMIPAKIVFLENLPITSSGKVDTFALQKFKPLGNPEADILPTDTKMNSETIANSNELETQLALIWKEILDINRTITNEDNFFELGGHSLTALRFVHLTKTRLGISFPLSKIFEIPTVKKLAFYIEKLNCPIQSLKNLPQCIVTVNGQGSKTPMFLVHSGFGFATEYLSLAEVDPDRPIYGINSRRFSAEFSNASEYDEKTSGFNNIEEMAACYVEDILRVCHDGAFIVGGWSFGGVVAVEISHILKQKGMEVELVILLDSFYNNRRSDMVKGNADIEANFPTLSAEEKSLIYRELESNCKLLKNHVVKPIPQQQVVLIKAQKSEDLDVIDNHNGWEGTIPMLKVIDISAPHYDMFKPTCIKDTIVALQKALEK